MRNARTKHILESIILIVALVWIGLYLLAGEKTELEKATPSAPVNVVPVPAATSSVDLPAPTTKTPPVQPIVKDTVTLAMGETAVLSGISITPSEVIEDSRCPLGVMCIQAGRVRLRAILNIGSETGSPIFLVGEPVLTDNGTVTLIGVDPIKRRDVEIGNSDYHFTFKVTDEHMVYLNAATSTVVVATPQPGAVVGKTFTVKGQAWGNWFFEGSFPVVLRDQMDTVISTGIAKADTDWMKDAFVPFTAKIVAPNTYSGPATLVLKKDNPSGLPANDASVAWLVHVEY